MEFWLLYTAVGAVVGFLAGLLGIGGGALIIPALLFALPAQQVSEAHAMHLALGTAMASILFGSVSSLREHHVHGAVNWPIVRALAPGVVIGGLVGAWLAARLSSLFLKVLFAVFISYMATQMLLNFKPKPTHQLPGRAAMAGVGGAIGMFSNLVGIGGAALSVPFMTWCNVKLHHAIGTSAAIGFPVALAGTLGYVANGLAADGLPAYSLGFVYLPALVGIAGVSVFVAPLGARAAHRLPVATLKKVFAVFLYALAAKMFSSLL